MPRPCCVQHTWDTFTPGPVCAAMLCRETGPPPTTTKRRGWARRRHARLPWGRTGPACRIRDARTWAARRLAPALQIRIGGRPRQLVLAPQFLLTTRLWHRRGARRHRVTQRRVERAGGCWRGARDPWTSRGVSRVGLPRGTRQAPGRPRLCARTAGHPWTRRSTRASTRGASPSLGPRQGGCETEHR